MSDTVLCPECSGCGHVGWADAPQMCIECYGAGEVPKHLYGIMMLNELSNLDEPFDPVPF